MLKCKDTLNILNDYLLNMIEGCLDTTMYDFIIRVAVRFLDKQIKVKNIPDSLEEEYKVDIVHLSLTKFNNHYKIDANSKPSTFFFRILVNDFTNSNMRNQKHSDTVPITDFEEVLMNKGYLI